ncbi:D-glycero-beta-D-manno-heptose 1,7-bisphosphate 7-phosphatase [Thalassotalea euphylliae]|uniref:D,D-heptose 1,7-bisphosphate phosphatase n=1 Tax=Thalassotalea euphylliae TaxID=1655234 RepID=A0A3E0TU21_9GAMM|nr:D-glycero-beta-D-manno-heptose 1,7-bisphosphate 7-phosphatase [Thalassotalea euphylliae]REL27415.1 D-glycero-beta-D-manno-heptose 1,7-bisphosphate 7-phosphatase [Thalassotalea euphylliae]
MKKALFLDRDGIINIDHGYVHKIEEFEFVDGIFDVCRYALDMGFEIIVITNQAGIARGYYTVGDFDVLTNWMKVEFAKRDIPISDVYFCPHHPDPKNQEQGHNEFVKTCDCRKPAPGMILQAAKDHNINIAHSAFIGDKVSDMKAAEAAGIHNKILVSSQYQDDESTHAHRITCIKEAAAFLC